MFLSQSFSCLSVEMPGCPVWRPFYYFCSMITSTSCILLDLVVLLLTLDAFQMLSVISARGVQMGNALIKKLHECMPCENKAPVRCFLTRVHSRQDHVNKLTLEHLPFFPKCRVSMSPCCGPYNSTNSHGGQTTSVLGLPWSNTTSSSLEET